MSSFSDFLIGRYADSHVDDRGFWHAGTPTRDSAATLTYLGQYDFLSVQGPDSRTFLQGQTTCDWRQLGAEQASWGSYCNIKGRMVASFIGGFLADDHILLRLRRDIAADTRDTLAKYIVFSKAEIDFQAGRWLALGLWGAEAGQVLGELGLAAPGAYMAQSTDGEALAVQLDSAGNRFEVWISGDSAAAVWQCLSDKAAIGSGEEWQRDNIHAGLADICAVTRDEFLPQMLHYQMLGGLSFKKGCYTGQEVIARMHYRGSLKRQLYRGHYDGEQALTEGEKIYADGDQSVGQVLHSVSGTDGADVLLVLSKSSAAQPDSLRSEGGATGLQLRPLPYVVPDDEGDSEGDSDN